MTQEEKQLLLKDLCARLPYGVIVSYQVGKNAPVNRVLTGKALDELVSGSYVDEWLKCSFKPYLRPMESMTEEEEIYYNTIYTTLKFYEKEDWLNAHHFDYRIVPSTGKTMIESNLAIEAPEGMYEI